MHSEELCLGREVLGDFDPTGCNLRPILLAKRSVAWGRFGSVLVVFFCLGGFPEEDVIYYMPSWVLESGPVLSHVKS